MDEKRSQKMQKIAEEILVLSRNTLLVNLRFLDMALSRLKYFPINEAPIVCTEGTCILYNPTYVLKCYKEEKELPVRDYLHMVLHCVFRHMKIDPRVQPDYWDIACDIAVEGIICELGIKSAACKRSKLQVKYLVDLKLKLKHLTAEKIYSYLQSNPPSPTEMVRLKAAFHGDNHLIWYMTEEERRKTYGFSDESEKNGSKYDRVFKDWKEVSRRMEMELETFLKERSDTTDSLTQNLKRVNRERYDYTSFLKKFAVMGETMKINDEEFDYIFYTYGLQQYGKMPLIEPLEYKETKLIKEFVIAIDTSGSTSGELVQRFVQKTYNIMKSTESFFSKINLYIIQCDCEIQEITKITCEEEFDEYIKNMKIHGLGGTDFRPVFGYVSDLVKNKEFSNLKGLIYFTDGYGVFPEKKPDYETAFVFIDDEENNYLVPPWAIKLILDKEDI